MKSEKPFFTHFNFSFITFPRQVFVKIFLRDGGCVMHLYAICLTKKRDFINGFMFLGRLNLI